MKAIHKLLESATRTAADGWGPLSVGLEPSAAYLPEGAGLSADLGGYERFLEAVIEGTQGIACAYKVNLAFFEALGSEGYALLERVRERVPSDAFFIADAKRGDIGSTAEQYASAVFEHLNADAVTVNPLMGRDSVEPFLAHAGKLTYLLCLTSNPGAEDFLLPGDLYLRIAEEAYSWDEGRGAIGLVVGATKSASHMSAIAGVAPGMPWLVPGIGVQGGDAASVWGACGGAQPLFHVTRGVLPSGREIQTNGGLVGAIRAKAEAFAAGVMQGAGTKEGSR